MNAVVGLLHQLVVIRSSVVWHAHVDHDPFARLQLAEGLRDPYALYAEVRARGQVVPSPTMGFQSASHQVCREVLRDRRFGVQVADGARGRRTALAARAGPARPHTAAAAGGARRSRRARWPATRERIETVVDGLLDALPRTGPVRPGDAGWPHRCPSPSSPTCWASPPPTAPRSPGTGPPSAARWRAAVAGPRRPPRRGRPAADPGADRGVRAPTARPRRRPGQPAARGRGRPAPAGASCDPLSCCSCSPASRRPST